MFTTCVVLPVYNEAAAIQRTLERVLVYAAAHPSVRFLFVDDGSSDQTAEYLERGLSNHGSLQVSQIRYSVNQGKGYAIDQGFLSSTEEYLIFTDGDLAYSLEHVGLIQQRLEEVDVVIGSRELKPYQPRNSSFRRQFLGRAFNWLTRLIAGLPYRDTQAGLKGFRRQAAVSIFARKRITGFGFDVEILYLAHRLGYRVEEIYAQVDRDHSYKNSKLKLLRDSASMFWDLLSIRWYDLRGLYKSDKQIQG